MSAQAIAQLILTLAQMTPQIIALAEQARAAMSATDQASVDTAIATLRQSALADASQAETLLDDAAKTQ